MGARSIFEMASSVSSDTVSQLLDLFRMRAQASLLGRMNCGYGFADTRIPSEMYLHDVFSRELLDVNPLRPKNTHEQPYSALLDRLSDAESKFSVSGSRFETLYRIFHLEPLEQSVCLAAFAYALDPDFRRICHAIAGNRQDGLYADVITEICPAFSTPRDIVGPLRVAGGLCRDIVKVEGNASPAFCRLGLRREILHWLLDEDCVGFANADVVSFSSAKKTTAYLPADVIRVLDKLGRQYQSEMDTQAPIVLLRGDPDWGSFAAAQHLAEIVGKPLAEIDLTRLFGPAQTKLVIDDLFRLLLLRKAIPYIFVKEASGFEDSSVAEYFSQRMSRFPGLVIAASQSHRVASVPFRRSFVAISLPSPGYSLRCAAWQHSLKQVETEQLEAGAAESLAGRFVIGPAAIAAVVDEAGQFATSHIKNGRVTLRQIEQAVARRLRVALGSLGHVVTRRARFEEMVVPAEVREELRNIVAMATKRSKILTDWGFERHLGMTRGISALFSGEPGTGKTMAAGVVAGELGLELMQIDLSSVVSKWVGETEKHLATIFDRAENANAMLLFDEADSLFGKRTELKSAQDRYANIGVNYILQRMDSFAGICILTTNFESSIDKAFLRRLRFRIRFPEPEIDERILLWQKLLPKETGIASAVDFRALGEKFEMTGGYIRNAIVRAAVLAARADREMLPADLVAGAHAEYLELGKVMPSLLTLEDE